MPVLWLMIAALLLLVFMADFQSALGLALPICSVTALLLIIGLPAPREKIMVATVATALTLLDYFLKPEAAGLPAWLPVINHGLTLILIWTLVVVCSRSHWLESGFGIGEAPLRAIMEASAQIVWTADAQGKMVDSPSWRAFTGQSYDEWKESGWLNAYHPDDRKKIQGHWQKAVAERTPLEAQYRLRRRDGQWRWTEIRAVPLSAPNGSIRGWIGMNTDITERKRAEASALFLLDLSECTRLAADPDELMWATAVAAGEHLQAARCCFLDIDPEGDRFTIHRDYHPSSPSIGGTYPLSPFGPAIISLGKAGRAGVVHDIAVDERTAPYADAYRQLGVCSFMAIPLLRDGQMVSALVVANLEARHWSEGEAALAKAVAERTWLAVEKLRLDAALRQSDEALREGDKRKDEFLATLAHELRNPLSLMRNVVNLIQIPGSSEDELRWGRDIMDRQVNYLTRLTDDLFDVSRITRQKLEMQTERVDIGAIVNAAVESSRPLIDERGHKLIVALPKQPVYVEADRIRLVQVFMTLLTNAAKYTPQPGTIWLNVEVAGGQVVVRVKDTGVGLSAESSAHVFDMFYQVDRSYARSEGGLGLGLTLVRQLVELQGGTVETHSPGLNQGSEFIVRLPQLLHSAVPPGLPTHSEQEKFPAAATRRILVADDFPESANALAKLLRADGNEVEIAQDGFEALDAAAKFRPQIVVLDIAMPKLNGYDTARIIREQPWGKQMILIAMTGWGQQQDRRRAKEAGFDAHLTKPVKYESLLAALDQTTLEKSAEINRGHEL